MNTSRLFLVASSLLASIGFVACSHTQQSNTEKTITEVISLAGEWRFQLDGEDVGVENQWFAKTLNDKIQLPGTTDENQKGIQQDERPTVRLMRPWYWKGPAWYQRDVLIPENWAGKRISLFLERTKNNRVWVNDQFCGWEDTISAPQVYDLTQYLSPGRHTITVLTDNSKLPPGGPSHAVDERTQTNWNGIVGRIELQATDPIWIEEVQVYPDVEKKEARLRVVLGNTTGSSAAGSIAVQSVSRNTENHERFATQSIAVEVSDEEQVVDFIYKPGDSVPLWDEFDPALIDLTVTLDTEIGQTTYSHTKTVTFGMREFSREGTQLVNNGKPIFLRGRLDCANYPLTGYPPMEKSDWLRILQIQKDWGLNHVRYHSWCPPKAAFEAADELGIYFQAELPNKRSGFKAPENEDAAFHNIDRLQIDESKVEVSLYDYQKREGRLISKYYGNHPSFTMFTLGNELGRNLAMYELVRYFRDSDPRRLYAQGSNNMHWKLSFAEGDDFWVTGKVNNTDKPLRGSFANHDFPKPHIDGTPPSTMYDFSYSIEGQTVPLIGHETGQFQVYPDFRDIEKFTGVTRARNYEIFRERLDAAGMLDQSHDFVKASGALSAICYREDIEAALRTPGFGGFQLLDIMDFPGQGTALVGMLNVFMEDKGVVEREKWQEFCAPIVPLFLMEDYTYTADQTLSGSVKVAHYGPDALIEPKMAVSLSNAGGDVLYEETLTTGVLEAGELHELGPVVIDFDTMQIKEAQELQLSLQFKGTDIRNDYPIWVYPAKVDNSVPEGVLLTRNYDEARTRLADGGKVLFIPELDKLPLSVQGAFQTEFWSPMFAVSARKRDRPEPPGTLGHLCDPEHPALSSFPTEFHSNWQWWHLVKNSRPIVLDDTPHEFRPIVQTIDNFERNHKLGLITEMKIGEGSLLFCAIDLMSIQDQPEGRQMLHSLLSYVGSDQFKPTQSINPSLLEKLVTE
jgi:hypothetical protein